MSERRTVMLHPLPGIPLVQPGDDLPVLLLAALSQAGLPLADGDVLVVAQKIVSKAEGRLVDLRTVTPSARAHDVATETKLDPRLVDVVLSESRSVLRAVPGVLIVETRHGFRCAHGGVDRSNVGPGRNLVTLLPADPDASAGRLRVALEQASGAHLAVIINDSHGRPWREGTVGVAIGAAGITAVEDLRGRADLFGRVLQTSTVGLIDELASAASLVMGGANEGVPAVLIRGAASPRTDEGARAILRPPERDLFP